jgi:hypothetical protein
MLQPKQLLSKLYGLWRSNSTAINEATPVVLLDLEGQPVDGIAYDPQGDFTGTATATDWALTGTVQPTLGAANFIWAVGSVGGNLTGGETLTLTLYRKIEDTPTYATVGTITAINPAVTDGNAAFVAFSDTSNLIKNSSHYKVTGTIVVGNGVTAYGQTVRTKVEGDLDAVVDELKIANGHLNTIKGNTAPLVVSTAGGYIRQDSTGTIAKESGGNLAAAATSVGSIDTKTPALGQALAAASVPVVLPALQAADLKLVTEANSADIKAGIGATTDAPVADTTTAEDATARTSISLLKRLNNMWVAFHAYMTAANTARTTATKVLPVQQLDAAGNVIGSSVTEASAANILAALGTTADAPVADLTTNEDATVRTGISLWKRTVNAIIGLLARFGLTTDTPLAGDTVEDGTARTGISLWKRLVNMNIRSVTVAEGGYNAVATAHKTSESQPLNTKVLGPTQLAATQAFTAAWVDIGAEIAVDGYDHLRIMLDIVANNSYGLQARALIKHTAAGAGEYLDEALIFDLRATNNSWTKEITLGNTAKLVQFQIKAAVVGASAGTCTATYTTGYAGGTPALDMLPQDYFHGKLCMGRLFAVTDYDSDVDTAAPKYWRITTAAGKCTFASIQIGVSGAGLIELYENPTLDAAGTAITVHNKNRNSANLPLVTFYYDTTTTADGTLLVETYVGSGTGGPIKLGGDHEIGYALKANEDYIIKYTPAANDQSASIWIEFEEKDI